MMSRKNSGTLTTIMLTMMSMMGLIASDIYIPGLSNIADDLKTDIYSVQLTIGIYLLGLAVFQLIYGPLSDRIGRKPVLLFGVLIYAIASLLTFFTWNIEQLLVLRFVQGCGACSGLVVGRAIISDLYDREEAAKIYNVIYPLVAASPAIAPLIGGYLIDLFGWRSTFLVIMIFASTLLFLIVFFLPETKGNTSSIKISSKNIVSDYVSVLANMDFWKYILSVLMLYGSWFTFITQASFIYKELGYTESEIGYFYIPLALMIYAGSRICKLMTPRIGIDRTFLLGLLIFLFGALTLFLETQLSQITSALQLIIPMSILVISNGIVLTLGISSAISLNSSKAGSASAVVGCCQIGFSALCASLFGYFFDVNPQAMAKEILALALLSFLGFIIINKLSTQKVML